jgi:uncharacterized protein (TIGR02757 family)
VNKRQTIIFMLSTKRVKQDLKKFLDLKVKEYNRPAFIPGDPISVPHRFTKKQDIEIAGFFAAVFAWGNRTTIIKKTSELMSLMNNAPHAFVMEHKEKELESLLHFCHRTFNATDLLYFISFLRFHYKQNNSLESAFLQGGKFINVENSLNHFHRYFFSLPDAPERTKKHIAAPFRNSSCKRLNMFLRWMVRKDDKGVDFGIWKKIRQSELICPVDLHVARVSRKLGLLLRKQTDWLAAVELTDNLKRFDPADPVKYDFALFSLGVIEKF